MTWEACGPKACRWNAPRLILFLASLRERVAMAQFRKQSTWLWVLCSSNMESASVCWASKLFWCYLGCLCNLNTWRLGLKRELLWIVTFSSGFGPCISSLKICSSDASDASASSDSTNPPQIGFFRWGSHTSGPDSSTFWNWWHSDSCLAYRHELVADRRSLGSWPHTAHLFRMLDEALEHI